MLLLALRLVYVLLTLLSISSRAEDSSSSQNSEPPEIKQSAYDANFDFNGGQWTFIEPDCERLGCEQFMTHIWNKASRIGYLSHPQDNSLRLSFVKTPENANSLVKRGLDDKPLDQPKGRPPRLERKQDCENLQEQSQNEQKPEREIRQCEAPKQGPKTPPPWWELQVPPEVFTQRYLDSTLVPNHYSFYRAVPGTNLAEGSPSFFQWLRQRYPIDVDTEKTFVATYFRVHVNHVVSPALLYGILWITAQSLDHPTSRRQFGTEREYMTQDQWWVNRGPDIERIKETQVSTDSIWALLMNHREPLRDIINDGSRNAFDGDPWIAVLRDRLVLSAMELWTLPRGRNGRVRERVDVSNEIPEKATTLVSRFDWKQMSIDEAISVRYMMQELAQQFLNVLQTLRDSLRDIWLAGRVEDPAIGILPEIISRFYQAHNGYKLASHALNTAINKSPSSFRNPPKPPGQLRQPYILMDRPRTRPIQSIRTRGKQPRRR